MRVKKNENSKIKIVLLGVIITLILLLYLSNNLRIENLKSKFDYEKTYLSPNYTYTVSMIIPAVDSYGEGVITKLKVQLIPGSGKTLVDINQLLFWIDTQQSIQIAKKVAESVTGADLSNFDIIYSIEDINASIIGGPSAGAAITIATIAAIKGREIKGDITITGTINIDGSIGPVGGIIPKASAAKNYGAAKILVPLGQGTQVSYVPREECEKIGSFTFCRITYRRELINVGKNIGIEVIEVGNIRDALKYFGL